MKAYKDRGRLAALLKTLADVYGAATLLLAIAALVLAIANPNVFEDLWSRRTRIAVAAAASGWLFAFSLPFAIVIIGDERDPSWQGGGTTAYAVFGAALVVGLLAAFVAARYLPPNLALLGGAVVAVGWWIAWSWGYWETHALGLKGRSVDDLASDDMGAGAYWLGVIIFSFIAVLPGLTAGALSLIQRHPPRHPPLEPDPRP